MQSTIASFQITAQSALSTLQICAAFGCCVANRWARRGTHQIQEFGLQTYRVLSSPEAVRTYKSLCQLFELCCLVAIALGGSAREVFEQIRAELDRSVENCLAKEQAVEPEAVSDPWEAPAPEPAVEPVVAIAPPAPVLLLPAAVEVAAPKRGRGRPRKNEGFQSPVKSKKGKAKVVV